MKKSEAARIIGPAEQVVRRSNYLSSKFSTDILRLPEMFGGYGSKDLHVQRVCEQGKIIVSALRRPDNTGSKLKILIAYHQLESGVRMSVLSDAFKEKLKHLTKTWVVRAVSDLHALGLEIRTEHWVPMKEGGDRIMEGIWGSER